ncbi:MAG TPA: 3-phosphoshikimate 1-carboxyvinyltransferase [Polyangiaceae bacterium]|nr:3-phosphoshikimate 1-carboxyvinyltransferase [Polyangiaceae bacterium]
MADTVHPASSYLVRPAARPVDATIRPPGSKSYTNRALLLAGLASGTSTLTGALFSDDTKHMARGLAALGLDVHGDETARIFTVTGGGGLIPAAHASVFVGNSGTTARFLAPMMALGRGSYELDGDEAMRGRPIQPLLDAMSALGARAHSICGNGCLPIRIQGGAFEGGATRMAGSVSSQFFSALLMVAPRLRRGIVLEVEGDLVSKPYLEVTAQAMKAFGATMKHDEFRRFEVAAGAYGGTDYEVEPDASAASYFFAAAAVTRGRVVVTGLGSQSLQGDLGFVHLLEKMGCRVRQTATETEVVGPAKLAGIEADMSSMSDTAQTIAAIAPLASSPTRITGIGFIRRKETNRIAAVVTELRKLGIRADEETDGFVVYPGQPRAGRIDTYDDHRMAMSFSVLGLTAHGIDILDPGCVSKTFPEYFVELEKLTGA